MKIEININNEECRRCDSLENKLCIYSVRNSVGKCIYENNSRVVFDYQQISRISNSVVRKEKVPEVI